MTVGYAVKTAEKSTVKGWQFKEFEEFEEFEELDVYKRQIYV